MVYSSYLIFCFSVYLMYYTITKLKDVIWVKLMCIIIAVGGIISSAALILEKQFPFLKESIRNILEIPIYLIIALGLLLVSINAWRMRKTPEKKLAAYLWFGALAFSLLIAIYITILKLS